MFHALCLSLSVQYVRFNASVSMTAIAGCPGGSRFLYTAAVVRNTLKSTTLSEKLLSTPEFKKLSFSRTGRPFVVFAYVAATSIQFSSSNSVFKIHTNISPNTKVYTAVPTNSFL